MNKEKFWNDPLPLLLASLTLGLAPFYPEPHVWGKLKWISGGAHGMSILDWWDFVMHSTPWVMLFRIVLIRTHIAIRANFGKK